MRICGRYGVQIDGVVRMDEQRSITKELVSKKLKPGIYRDDKYLGFCLKVTPAGR